MVRFVLVNRCSGLFTDATKLAVSRSRGQHAEHAGLSSKGQSPIILLLISSLAGSSASKLIPAMSHR
jgi:hypothetical protein